jgi:glutamine amidotransferase-like uncharacterized protein
MKKIFISYVFLFSMSSTSFPIFGREPIVRALVYDDSFLGPIGRGTSLESIKNTLSFFSSIFPNISTITPSELKNGKLQKGDLFILPGGRDRPYHAELKGDGNKILDGFVKKGGSILGICAGAYYFGTEVKFNPKNPQFSVNEKRNLSFYPGAVIGPLFGDKNYNPFTSSGVHAASVVFKGESTSQKVFYNGGGYFEALAPLPPHIEVLAIYEENKEAAIVRIQHGEGLVILSSVHFEYNPDTILIPDKKMQIVKKELTPYYSELSEKIKNLFLF